MSKSLILVLPERDTAVDVQVVSLKKKFSRTPVTIWTSLDAANYHVNQLVAQHPEHLFLVVESMTFQAEWEDDAVVL